MRPRRRASGVVMDIRLLLREWMCHRKHEIRPAGDRRLGGFFVVGDVGRHLRHRVAQGDPLGVVAVELVNAPCRGVRPELDGFRKIKVSEAGFARPPPDRRGGCVVAMRDRVCPEKLSHGIVLSHFSPRHRAATSCEEDGVYLGSVNLSQLDELILLV